MKTFTFFFKITLLIITVTACNTGVPKGVIPVDKMIPIIEDVHVADAMLLDQGIQEGQEQALSFYVYIYKKHGITEEEFERSIAYYAKNPKKLRKAYDEVYKHLETRDSLLKVAAEAHTDTLQIWKGRSAYKVEKYTKETLPVSVLVRYPKTYTVSAEIKIYKDSQVKEVSPHFAFVAPDTSYVLPTQKITADTVFQKFKISEIVADSTVVRLEGDFFPAQNDSLEQFKHYEIRKIQIMTTDVNFTNELDKTPER